MTGSRPMVSPCLARALNENREASLRMDKRVMNPMAKDKSLTEISGYSDKGKNGTNSHENRGDQ